MRKFLGFLFCGFIFSFSIQAETTPTPAPVPVPTPAPTQCVATVKRLVAYYAHPIPTYNTAVERRDLEVIAKLGFDVLNPNGSEHDAGYKQFGMAYFKKLVTERCDLLFFRALPDGSIPAGVAEEIKSMQAKGGMIIELPSAISRRTLTVEQTRQYLEDSGYR